MGNTDYQIYYMANSLDTVRGGLTRNLLNRAKILSEKLGQTIHILTFNFNPDYDIVRNELKRLNMINEHIVIDNLFEFLSPKAEPSADFQAIHHPVEEDGLVVDKVKDKNAYRLYRNGLYIKYKRYSDDGKLQLIDYFNENRYRTRREQFDARGRLRRIIYMDYAFNKPCQSRYFDEGGHCFLSTWYNPQDGNCTRINWFDRQGSLKKVFHSEKALSMYWLDNFTENLQDAIFQSEKRKTDDLLLAIKNQNIAKVIMMHSNHLNEPYEYGSPVLKQHDNTLKKADKFDALVFITERQKHDVERQFGPRTTYHAVQHFAPKVAHDNKVAREPFTAVAVSRFVVSKNLDHAVRAFQKVVKQVPEAKLELWGFGPEEKNLAKLIKELKLETSVFIKGFTDDAVSVFERAAFSIFTPKREGFGLVVAESMAAGAPVISYDVNYGPREMITHDVDGMLVAPNDIEALRNAMITLFTDQEKRKAMSRAARKINEKLNEETFVRKWLEVYKAASEQKRHRIEFDKPGCTLTNLEWVDSASGKIKLEGDILFSEETNGLKDTLRLSLYIRKRDRLVDCYVPLKIDWRDKQSARFSGQLTLNDFRDNGWIKKGVWDLYVSCSARNGHQFVRLSGGEQKKLPAINRRISTNDHTSILPYYTQYGNVSLDVGEKKHNIRNNTIAKKIARKLKKMVSLT